MSTHHQLDASNVSPSLGARLKNSCSMLEFNEIASIKKCDYEEDSMIRPSYDRGENENMYGTSQESGDGSDDHDDFCFLDIESEIQVPLHDDGDIQIPPSNKKLQRMKSMHRPHSMSELNSFTVNEDELVNRTNQSHPTEDIGTEGGLIRVDSKSILKSSPDYVDAPQDQMPRTASFGTLEIREYPITLGDNPGGVQGPPITLDWQHNEKQTRLVELENYEDTRGPRRDRRELYMGDNLRRWRLLRENGFKMEELNRACSDAENVRRQRRKSLKPEPALSKMKKKIGKMIGSSNKEIGRCAVGSIG